MLNPHKMKLGKQPYEQDPRTLALVEYLSPELAIPAKFDFDKNRAEFPLSMMGNDKWNNSVIVGQANHLLRIARIEERRTLSITAREVNDRYKKLSGAATPGDDWDTGITVLRGLRDWRAGIGWRLGDYAYSITAFGELDPHDEEQLRDGIFAFHGIQLGFWLPRAVQFMEHVWNYDGQKGEEWKPGSWGGQLAYAKAFTPSYIEIISWGQRFQVMNNFIDRYCDEAWAVIDSLDRHVVDVERLSVTLAKVTANGKG